MVFRILRYLDTIDIRDIKSYKNYLAGDYTIQINNNQHICGKDEIVKHTNSSWVLYKENIHDLLNIYGSDSSIGRAIEF